ncbi:MAG: dTMP kinase [Phormidesmis sp. RL_2_1]|nr:dTMP kinase [Phormidesmis sp. RL_2_1]
MGSMTPGKLIVFEGGEGSGKTTQIQRLHDWLSQGETLQALQRHHGVAGIKLTREPGGTALGQHIRHLLLSPSDTPILSNTELLLYAADRTQHVEETLRPWLTQGYWVLCDRYTDSTVAYQGYGRQLDLKLIDQLNQIATGGLKTDLTLWLKLSPAVGLARMRQRAQADRIEQASLRFHQRVADGFAALAQPMADGRANPMSSGPIAAVEGDRSIEAIAAHIQQILQQKLAQWYPLLSQKPAQSHSQTPSQQ